MYQHTYCCQKLMCSLPLSTPEFWIKRQWTGQGWWGRLMCKRGLVCQCHTFVWSKPVARLLTWPWVGKWCIVCSWPVFFPWQRFGLPRSWVLGWRLHSRNGHGWIGGRLMLQGYVWPNDGHVTYSLGMAVTQNWGGMVNSYCQHKMN